MKFLIQKNWLRRQFETDKFGMRSGTHCTPLRGRENYIETFLSADFYTQDLNRSVSTGLCALTRLPTLRPETFSNDVRMYNLPAK
jgi:hypothetical protein